MASQDGDDWNLTFGADTLVQNGTITITNEKNTTPDTTATKRKCGTR